MKNTTDIVFLLKALLNPVRIALLRELITCKNCINGELVSKFPLSQSTVSQHLEVLAKAGLIRINRQGKISQYCISRESFMVQLNHLKDFADVLIAEFSLETAR